MFSPRRFFRSTHSPRRGKCFQPLLEELETRWVPATFTPHPTLVDGASLSLRDAILQANSNGDANNTINLASGTYKLTDAVEGNLLIQDTASGVASKTLTIIHLGAGSAIITGSSSWQDRIFEILGTSGASVSVLFQNVTIEGGNAQNDGRSAVAWRWAADCSLMAGR